MKMASSSSSSETIAPPPEALCFHHVVFRLPLSVSLKDDPNLVERLKGDIVQAVGTDTLGLKEVSSITFPQAEGSTTEGSFDFAVSLEFDTAVAATTFRRSNAHSRMRTALRTFGEKGGTITELPETIKLIGPSIQTRDWRGLLEGGAVYASTALLTARLLNSRL